MCVRVILQITFYTIRLVHLTPQSFRKRNAYVILPLPGNVFCFGRILFLWPGAARRPVVHVAGWLGYNNAGSGAAASTRTKTQSINHPGHANVWVYVRVLCALAWGVYVFFFILSFGVSRDKYFFFAS